MFGFGGKRAGKRCAMIIDIGSGSVGMAIVVADEQAEHPKIVWSHRERAVLRNLAATTDTLKHINTALINCFLECNNQGLAALREFDANLHIKTVQAAIAAPWSYTVTKTVRFTDEKPFTVDEELVTELTKTAETQARAAIQETGIATQGLELINDATIDLRINGYPITQIVDQEGHTVAISHISALAHEAILEVLRDSLNKILPKAELYVTSFMYLYYCMLQNMHVNITEACLVDVTNEATEVAVIRDGILKNVTNAPYGTFTLAREIATACSIPKEEAFNYLKAGGAEMTRTMSATQLDQLRAVISAYELKLSTLFQDMNDDLAIPRTIFLHTDHLTEEFFATHINVAAEDATHTEHTIHRITAKLLEANEADDTPLLLSAEFFHRHLECKIILD